MKAFSTIDATTPLASSGATRNYYSGAATVGTKVLP